MESLCPTDIFYVELFHTEVVISLPFETLDCDTGTNNDDGQHNEIGRASCREGV